MEHKKKTQKKIKTDLCRNLKQGALLYMDGQLAAPSKISAVMLREGAGYMADYVTDDKGNLCEIHYDKIVQSFV